MLQFAKDGNHEQLKKIVENNYRLVECEDKRTGFKPLHFACHNLHHRYVLLMGEC